MTHPVLRRQLRRLGLNASAPPEGAESWTAFLERVEAAYATADQERYLLERSFELSSEEMRELYSSLGQRETEQAALRRVATMVAADETPESIFQLVAQESASVVGASAGRVFRFEGKRGVLVGTWGSSPELSASEAGAGGIPLNGATATARVARTGTTSRVEDYAVLDDPVAGSLAERTFQSGVAAPIRVQGRLWGAVAAMSTSSAPLPEFAEETFSQFADLVALAISSSAARSELARRATTDPLTGLPNRTLFDDRLGQVMSLRQRDSGSAAVILMDLDRFKEVNDTLGHSAGDALLREVALRLRSCLRESDTVARLGGDEFVILVPDCPDAAAALAVADTLDDALSEPFTHEGLLIEVTGSLGVSFFPQDGRSAEELIQHADVAMYIAKASREGAVIYSPEQDQHTPERLALVGELRRAIDNGELVVEYQPKIDLRSNDVVGAEALVRWQHPDRGLLGPDDFIPVAEHTALIKPLTLYVLDRALEQSAVWAARGLSLRVSVNVSTASLADRSLPAAVLEALDRVGLDPECLELEITETALMLDPNRSLAVLQDLRLLGVRISIDDFGTGYSSLAYLKDLPIDALKIDRSFVACMEISETDAMIVRSTIELAHNLRLSTVAEGVEETSHVEALKDLGCDAAQGFLVARPLPAQDFADWVDGWDGKQIGDLIPSRAAVRPAATPDDP